MNFDYDPKKFKAGEMNTDGHQETFDGFMKTCVVTTVVVIAILIVLIIVGT